MTKGTALSLVVAFLATACATYGPEFSGIEEPADGRAVIYIYRVAKFAGSGIYPRIAIDGEGCHHSKSGTFVRLEVEPGPHEVAFIPGKWKTIEWEASAIQLILEPGEVQFLKYVTNLENLSVIPAGPTAIFSSSFSYALYSVDRQTGMSEIANTHFVSSLVGCES